MKCMVLEQSAGAPRLIEKEIAQPGLRKGEVLLRVHAAGVTPTELLWYPTTHTKDGGIRSAAVPSHEFSGVVAAIAEGVEGMSAGQEIYGMNDWFADGALAEYCVTRPEWIAPKPARLSHPEAASVPMGALTAWQGLFERAQIQAGERLLVHGGAGAVGVFAIQLAHALGARVITTVSPKNFGMARELGADETIDYKSVRFEDQVGDIDVVFDAVGDETLQRSWGVLKPNGRLVTIASNAEGATEERVKKAFFIVEPKHRQLVEIGERIDSGQLRPVVDTVAPWSRASAAYAGKIERKGRGKVVIAVIGQD